MFGVCEKTKGSERKRARKRRLERVRERKGEGGRERRTGNNRGGEWACARERESLADLSDAF